jgi:hypothetical protein
MKKKHLLFFAGHVILPLLVGGLVYMRWRGPDLLMFHWFRMLGVEPLVLRFNVASAGAQPGLPLWLIYSLPDGLWVYALTAFFVHIWSGVKSSPVKIFFLSLSLVLGAGSELGQLVRLVPGTFDWIDFFFYIIAAVLAFYFASGNNPERSLNESTSKTDNTLAFRSGGFPGLGIRQRVLDQQERKC